LNLDQYLGLFIDESKENLQILNDNLLKLEKSPESTEILDEIFRVAHTFKGMSKTMGFNATADLTHNMENLLEPLRSGKKKADGKIVDILFKCLDKLEGLVDSVIEKGSEDPDASVNELVEQLKSILSTNDADTSIVHACTDMEFDEFERSIIDEAIRQDLIPKEITVYISNDCVLPGVRSYMINSILDNEGEIVKYMPTVEEIESGVYLQTPECNHVVKVLIATKVETEELKKKILAISEISNVEVVNITNFSKKTDEQQENKPQAAQILEAGDENKEDLSQAQKGISKVANQTIRVNAGRLDKLMNLVGELVINKTRVFQLSRDLANQDLINTAGFMENITGEIQEIVMKLRLVPIDQVFNRFPRLVRDISKSLNKEVNLVIKGKEIEIDRAVIDEIGDPLVHLIRNSLDHGLETPEERIKNDKPAKGTIELSAASEGDNIVIRISDDGKGIDPERIKTKAIDKGFLTQEAARTLTENEVYDLIFKPGFSTMEVATDLSGRGVGMDVVKSKVGLLGGTANISSKVGKGTVVTITLPSTMAIIQSLLVKTGEETYALPLNYINEVIDIPSSEVKRIQNNEVITVREKTIPLIRLSNMLETPNYVDEDNTTLTVVIVKSQDRYCGVSVSELVGQQEIVIKPINKKLSSANFISGATTLGNGEVAFILNINSLI